MKKLFFVGALALSTFTFANIKEEAKHDIKQEKTTAVKKLTPKQKAALAGQFPIQMLAEQQIRFFFNQIILTEVQDLSTN